MLYYPTPCPPFDPHKGPDSPLSHLQGTVPYLFQMFIGVLFWYQLYNGFSGSNAIDDASLILFNLLFTSIPPVIGGVWDQCLSERTVLSKPMLYRFVASMCKYHWSRFRPDSPPPGPWLGWGKTGFVARILT